MYICTCMNSFRNCALLGVFTQNLCCMTGLPDSIFLKQKIKIWVNFIRAFNGISLEEVGIIFAHLVYFTDIWYHLWPFGIFPTVLVRITEKNLATLLYDRMWVVRHKIHDSRKHFFSPQKCDFFPPEFGGHRLRLENIRPLVRIHYRV
jgi:hypothetical protein